MGAAHPASELRQAILHQRLLATLVPGATEDPPPQTIGRFVIEGRLGAGGMGTVWLATDPQLGRSVAVKLMHLRVAAHQAALLREARVLARIDHPNVVRIFDVGRDEEATWLAMEHVEGTTLGAWLGDGPPWREVVAAFVGAARGLAAAHRVGVVHGDFKPSNALRAADGRIVVIDFGLARWRDRGPLDDLGTPAPATDPGASLHGGTAGYIAPEKLAGAEDTALSDEYSLCVALGDALARCTDGQDVPRNVLAIVRRGLQADPRARWPDLEQLARALERAAAPRAWWPLGIGFVALAVTAPIATSAQHAAPTCAERVAEALAPIWNDDRRMAVRERFAAIDRPFAPVSLARFEQAVDAYAERLAADRTAACEASRTTEANARELCLDRRTEAFAELVGVYRRTITVDRAAGSIGAALALAPTTHCLDPAYLEGEGFAVDAEPDDPAAVAQREQVRAIVDALDRNGKLMSGAPGDAVETARLLLAEATALGDEPTRVRAINDLAVMLHRSGKVAEAQPLFDEAFFAARAAHMDVLALKIASNLVALHDDRGEYDEALAWERHAATLVDRAPDPIVASKLHFNVAIVLQHLERLPEARERLVRALEIRTQILGLDHPTTLNARLELANVTVAEGDTPAGRAEMDKVLALYEQAFGPDHPDVAIVVNNLGRLDAQAGDPEGAKAQFLRAIAIRERAFGPDHPSLSGTLLNLAKVEEGLGDLDAARALGERALAIRTAQFRDDHPNVVAAREFLAGLAPASTPSPH